MEISKYLRQHARTIAGKSQFFVNSFAKALEVHFQGSFSVLFLPELCFPVCVVVKDNYLVLIGPLLVSVAHIALYVYIFIARS
jgi:hypothetical protein